MIVGAEKAFEGVLKLLLAVVSTVPLDQPSLIEWYIVWKLMS